MNLLSLPSRAQPASLQFPRQLEQVELFMRQTVRGKRLDRTSAMALEQISSGGKRLRAQLALLACDAFSVPESSAIIWAAAVELLHNATLVHDDIQDGDEVRRGQPTLWVKHGLAQALNAGDFLLMAPFLALQELPAHHLAALCPLLAEAAANVVRGQVEELDLLASNRLDFESYARAAAGKTGGLLALPVVGAATLGGCPPETMQELRGLFTRLGVLFQQQDDVVDLFGDKGRKQIGCDIYEGKVSALVVAHIERRPDQREELVALLRQPRQETTSEDIQKVQTWFVQSGALDEVLQRILDSGNSILQTPLLLEHPALARVTEQLIELSTSPIQHLLDFPQKAAQ